MKLLTPERSGTIIETLVTADVRTAFTNPAGTGQVMVINAVDIVVAAPAISEVDARSEGTVALVLTEDVATADINGLGMTNVVDNQEADNQLIAAMDYALVLNLVTSGAAEMRTQKASWSWRGLDFENRPMTNVDPLLILQVSLPRDIDVAVRIAYQVAELERGDLSLGSILPVGARIVRGPQIPEKGVAGPAGRIL